MRTIRHSADPDDNLTYSQPAEAMSYVQYKIRENNSDAASFGKVYSSGGKVSVSCESPAVPADRFLGDRTQDELPAAAPSRS